MRRLIVVAALGLWQPSQAGSTDLAGAYWTHLTAGERQAYLNGFVAGAAAEQVRARAVAAHRDEDSVAVSSAAVASLREQSALRFHFAPNVYEAQIDDFYWWQGHAATPIVDAMVVLNRAMLDQQGR